MDIEILTQPKLANNKDYSLGEQLVQLLSSKRPKFTEVSFFFGLIKDNAFDKVFEYIKAFILNGGNFKFYLSQPQKGNIKKIINSLLELGCEVYLFKNEGKDFVSDFQYKGAIFENEKKAVLLLSSGNFSLSGLFDGYNTVTQFNYDLTKEKDEFLNVKNSIFSENINNHFEYVTRENFAQFFSTEIPSIEEFTHKDIEQTEPIITSLDDINIDIEIDDNVDFLVAPTETDIPKKEQKSTAQQQKKEIPELIDAVEFEETKYYLDSDALDIENMLFTASSSQKVEPIEIISEPAQEVEEQIITEGKIIAKSANLSKTSIFMLQLPKITKKGSFAGEIKIPSYLRDLIPAFWGWPKEYSLKKDSNEKSRICTFKIIDTINADKTIVDEQVKLFQREGENSFSIFSEKLIDLDLHENDIIRFIKTQSANGSYFTCEVVRTDDNEYPIWEQFCTNLLKGSKRKYGMM